MLRMLDAALSETYHNLSSGVWDDDKAIDPVPAPCLEQPRHLRAVVAQVSALPPPHEYAGLRPRDGRDGREHRQAVQPPDAPQQADAHRALLLAQVRRRADAAHVRRARVRAIRARVAH